MAWFDLLDTFFIAVAHGQDGWFCALQASTIQFFNIGSKIWEVFMAVELWVLVSQIANKVEHASHFKFLSSFYRHGIYWGIILTHGIVTVSIMLSMNVWAYGKWCWISDPDLKIYFCYMQLWIGMVIIICCNYLTCRMMYRLIKRRKFLQEKLSGHSNSDVSAETGSNIDTASNQTSSKGNDQKLQGFFVRMYFVPVTFIMVNLPGSVRRGLQWTNKFDSLPTEDKETIISAQAFMTNLKAFFNMLLIVAIDSDLRDEYYIYFKEMFFIAGFSLGFDMSTSNPLWESRKTEESIDSKDIGNSLGGSKDVEAVNLRASRMSEFVMANQGQVKTRETKDGGSDAFMNSIDT